MSRPRRARALAAALAVVAGACSPALEPASPEAALVSSVRDTLDGSFAYRLVAEADREALDDLGSVLGSVAARLNLFEVSGVVDGDAVSVDVAVFGTAPLAQLRRFGDDQVFVRVGFGDGPLSWLSTPELEGRLLGIAVQTDQPDSVVAAIGVLFDGDWVAVEGEFDPSALTGLGAPGAGAESPSPALATPLPEIVADYITVVDQADDDGATTLRVDLRIRALLRALASLGGGLDAAGVDEEAFEAGLGLLPEVVTGDVVRHGDVIESFVFDVAAAARQAGDQINGSLQLRLELSEHGRPRRPSVPEARITVPSGELAAGLAQLLSTPVPSGSPTSSPS